MAPTTRASERGRKRARPRGPTTRARRRDAESEGWKWLLWDSDLARDKIHPEIGAAWTAVLKEACCVRKDVDDDKVERLREDGDRQPLRLWPKATADEKHDFKGMVPTVPLLEWCVRREYEPDAATIYATARGGDIEALRWLRIGYELKLRGPPGGSFANVIPFIRFTRVERSEWSVVGSWYEVGGSACAGAARGGHLYVLKWLRNEMCPWDNRTCIGAAEGGHLHVLKYAHENGCIWDEQTCFAAALGGHLHVLKYAHHNGCPWAQDTCMYAAKGGHLNVLKYLHHYYYYYLRENGCPWNEETCTSAAREGHLNVLKYAHENGCPWNEETCASAAREGHLNVLKYLHENGCPWNKYTCRSAAYGGHLRVLKYAHENGCPWDEDTCKWAASEGNLDVLKYAHENGCPWNEFTCANAAHGGHLDVLKYLHENGCPWDERTCSMAAEGGRLDVLKYARANGCPWDDKTCEQAARRGYLNVLKYARENGCPFDKLLCLDAAREIISGLHGQEAMCRGELVVNWLKSLPEDSEPWDDSDSDFEGGVHSYRPPTGPVRTRPVYAPDPALGARTAHEYAAKEGSEGRREGGAGGVAGPLL